MQTSQSSFQPIVDRISVFIFGVLIAWQLHTLYSIVRLHHGIVVLLAFILSIPLADFTSGLVHWAADTWGTAQWPIVGPALIGPFREHHVDKKAITRHDFYETNGNNCLVSIPPLLALFAIRHFEFKFQSFVFALLLGLTIWIFMTNQFHKWSHQDQVPSLVNLLQQNGLILSPDHHEFHHMYPFTKNYCITTGWMNPILNKTKFFLYCEHVITKCTGAHPRQDDLDVIDSETA